MMHRRRRLAAVVQTLFELLLTAGAFGLAAWIRSAVWPDPRKPFSLGEHLWLLPLIGVVWVPLLWRWGLHRSRRTDRPGSEIARVVRIVLVGMLIVVAAIVLRKFDPSRIFLAGFALLDALFLIAFRLAAAGVARHQRRRGYDRSFILVAGTGKAARDHLEVLGRHPEWGFEVRGVLSEGPKLALDRVAGVPLRGSLEDLPALLRGEVVDEVHFAVSRRALERLESAVRVCDEMGVTVRLAMPFLSRLNARPSLEVLEGRPWLSLSSTPRDEAALLVKRVLDVVVSTVLLILTAPLMVLVALAIRLDSRGPVLFRQKRSGMNGRIFTLYKFRTMVEGAEALKEGLRGRNEMDGPVFKIRDDPRVTRVGRILRRLSIDELPQLWNVLRGDMSLVGPRPPLPEEVEKYQRWQRRRLSMRPGITCIWQVSGRNEVSFARWMEMDLEYIDHWSLALDFKILLKTIPAVLFSRGAS